MDNAATVASPGEEFGGASQREKNGGSQNERIEAKSVTKEEQAEIDKLKQEMEEYKAELKEYKEELKEYKKELKVYKAESRIQEAQRCEEIILQKEALIQQLYAGIREKEASIRENKASIREKESRKRQRAVDAAAGESSSKFMRSLPKASRSGNLITFDTELFQNQESGNVMFVRQCFGKFYDMIIGAVKGAQDKGNTILNVRVTGTPGIGKTVCGRYVMLRLLVEERKTVVYIDQYDFNTHSGSAYLLGPKDSTIVRCARENGHVIEEGDSEYWWGEILVHKTEGQELLKFLLNQPDLWCVLDSPQTGITIPQSHACIKVVFSSPHRGSKNTLKGREVVLYMPLWDWEELHRATQDLKLGISDSELCDRFTRFGGIARGVLVKDFTHAMAFFNENIRSLTLQNAQQVLDPFSDNAERSSLFTHIVPSEDFMKYTTRVSSDMVARYVRVQAALSQNWDMREWTELAKRWGLKGAAGDVFECVWHNAMALGREARMKCQLRDLQSGEVTTVWTPDLQLPAKTFDKNDMKDLHRLEEKQYCLPLTPNFETVDSWLVMRKPFVDEGNEKLCLVQFQVTTAAQHGLKAGGGIRVIKKAESLFGVKDWEIFNIYIVFVVLEHNLAGFKKQKWTAVTIEEMNRLESLNEIRQFALAMPKESEPDARCMSLETD